MIKEKDLPDGWKEVEILRNVSSQFLEDIIENGLDGRATFINKRKKDSVSVPSNILRGIKYG